MAALVRVLGNSWQVKKKMQNHDGNHDGVITHLEPDNLECKVKWALSEMPSNWPRATQMARNSARPIAQTRVRKPGMGV